MKRFDHTVGTMRIFMIEIFILIDAQHVGYISIDWLDCQECQLPYGKHMRMYQYNIYLHFRFIFELH